MSNRKNRRMFFKKRKYGIVLRGMFFGLRWGIKRMQIFGKKICISGMLAFFMIVVYNKSISI